MGRENDKDEADLVSLLVRELPGHRCDWKQDDEPGRYGWLVTASPWAAQLEVELNLRYPWMRMERGGPWEDVLDAWSEFGLRLAEPSRRWGDHLALERHAAGYRFLVGAARFDCPDDQPRSAARNARLALLRAFSNFLRGRAKSELSRGEAVLPLEASEGAFVGAVPDDQAPLAAGYVEFCDYLKTVDQRLDELQPEEVEDAKAFCACAEGGVGPGPAPTLERLALERGVHPSTLTRRRQKLLEQLAARFRCRNAELLLAMICTVLRKPAPARPPEE